MRSRSRLFALTFAGLSLASYGCAAENTADDLEDDSAELSGDRRYFLSDLSAFAAEASGHGPIGRDQSNGELAANDGKPIKLRGHRYQKGLGVHSPSEIRVNLGGKCSRFMATVGIDDEVAPHGSVSFEVLADGTSLLATGELTGTSAPQPLTVNVTGKRELTLIVRGGTDAYYDHADWANARVFCSEAPPTPAPVVDAGAPPSDAAPAPSPVDPFDATSCTGAPISLSQAKAKFPGGAMTAELGRFTMAARKRDCNDTTGCGAWASFDKLPYRYQWSDPRAGAMSNTNYFPLVSESDPARLWFAARTHTSQQDEVRLRLSYLHGADGVDLNLRFDASDRITDHSYYPSWVGPCTELGCSRAYRVYGGSVNSGLKEALVTPSCLRLVTKHVERANRAATFAEYETAFYAKY